jgi:PAS domain S-box-containing protein
MAEMFPEPCEANGYLAAHVADLLRCHLALTGKPLMQPGRSEEETAGRAYRAPFILLSHDGGKDPRLTYGNLAAQELFGMHWNELVGMPSRKTAEAPERAEREELLRRVTETGFISDYSGIRIAADGRRFKIRHATVWNVRDPDGRRIGQAAAFSDWEPL